MFGVMSLSILSIASWLESWYGFPSECSCALALLAAKAKTTAMQMNIHIAVVLLLVFPFSTSTRFFVIKQGKCSKYYVMRHNIGEKVLKVDNAEMRAELVHSGMKVLNVLEKHTEMWCIEGIAVRRQI